MGEKLRSALVRPQRGAPGHLSGQLARVAALLACLLAFPLTATSAQTNELAVRYNDTASTQPAPTSDDAFSAQFADVLAPVGPNLVDLDLVLPDTAVDLGTFEPPREAQPNVLRTLGTGVASYYGRRFHGRLTANGERFNMNAMTAAHKTLPFGTRVRVTNPRNGRSVTVRINDRGPFIRGRTIDLSRGAAERIGMIASGHARVKLDIVSR
jgi:peptidoglycan lytic transglycosylase